MAIWKIIKAWKSEYFTFDEELPNGVPSIEFLDLWHKKRGDKIAPAWADFDLADLEPWWGSVFVIDFQAEPFDFKYRLFGTKAVALFGYDLTGKWASESFGSKYDLVDDMDFYEMLMLSPHISYSHGTVYWQNRDHVECSFFELPLSSDGKTITNMISILHSSH